MLTTKLGILFTSFFLIHPMLDAGGDHGSVGNGGSKIRREFSIRASMLINTIEADEPSLTMFREKGVINSKQYS